MSTAIDAAMNLAVQLMRDDAELAKPFGDGTAGTSRQGIGGRAYIQGTMPRDTTFPRVLVYMQSSDESTTLNGEHVMTVGLFNVQLQYAGASVRPGREIGRRIRLVLNRKGGTRDGCYISTMYKERDIPEPPTVQNDRQTLYKNQQFRAFGRELPEE